MGSCEKRSFRPFCILYFFSFFLYSYCKKIDNKSVSGSNFTFINPCSAHSFLKDLEKRRHFRGTGFLRCSKLVHLEGKKLACFN